MPPTHRSARRQGTHQPFLWTSAALVLLLRLLIASRTDEDTAAGRWGGLRLKRRLGRLVGGDSRIDAAEEWLKRHGGLGVFLSRWLLTPLGPVVNVTRGATGYPWPRFLLYGAVGEALWVVLYVLLGELFSDRVQAMSEVMGDFTWALVGLVAAAALGWILVRYFRSPEQAEEGDESAHDLG